MGKAQRKKLAHKSAERGSPAEVQRPAAPDATAPPHATTALIVLIAASCALYAYTLSNGFVIDDMTQVLQNPWIRDVRHLPEIFSTNVWAFQSAKTLSNYYRPLMHVIYMGSYFLFGLKPWGYHLVSVLFHAANTALLFLILSKLETRLAPRRIDSSFLSLPVLAAALFAVHPINSEAVAWVAAITDLSYTFFCLLSLYCYLRSRDGVRMGPYLLSAVFFAIALLCKETAITLKVMLSGKMVGTVTRSLALTAPDLPPTAASTCAWNANTWTMTFVDASSDDGPDADTLPPDGNASLQVVVDWGDGTTKSFTTQGATVVHTYIKTGTFAVSEKVTDSKLQQSTSTQHLRDGGNPSVLHHQWHGLQEGRDDSVGFSDRCPDRNDSENGVHGGQRDLRDRVPQAGNVHRERHEDRLHIPGYGTIPIGSVEKPPYQRESVIGNPGTGGNSRLSPDKDPPSFAPVRCRYRTMIRSIT